MSSKIKMPDDVKKIPVVAWIIAGFVVVAAIVSFFPMDLGC